LKYLIIEINDNNICENLENYILSISLNNYNIISLNLNFIDKLEGHFIYDNKFILNLPHSYLIDLYRANDTFFTIKIKSYNKTKLQIFNKIYLLCENILLNDTFRKTFFKETQKVFYQNIYEHDMNTFHKKSRQHFSISNYLKGFFMECNMKEFNKITFLINLTTKFIYDKLFLRLYAFEIQDDLWYIPINHKNNYKDKTFESYYQSINCDKIDSIQIIIEFNNDEYRKIMFYFLTSDYFYINYDKDTNKTTLSRIEKK
jgi:hypothetical protein